MSAILPPAAGSLQRKNMNWKPMQCGGWLKNWTTPELAELFAEFEEQKTPEAVFVRNMDKLDAVIQARYYDETQTYGGRLFEEFYNYAEEKITHPQVLSLLRELKKQA